MNDDVRADLEQAEMQFEERIEELEAKLDRANVLLRKYMLHVKYRDHPDAYLLTYHSPFLDPASKAEVVEVATELDGELPRVASREEFMAHLAEVRSQKEQDKVPYAWIIGKTVTPKYSKHRHFHRRGVVVDVEGDRCSISMDAGFAVVEPIEDWMTG